MNEYCRTENHDCRTEVHNSYFPVKCFNGAVLRTRCEFADTSEASSATHRVRKTPIKTRNRNKTLCTGRSKYEKKNH